GFDYDLSIESASYADVTFNEIEEAADNNSIGDAQSLTGDIPVAVEATAAGTDIDDLDADYFSVTLDAGESLGLFTGPGLDDQIDDADTVLFVLDPDGNEIYFNDDYPLAGNFFSAGLITADQAGDYIVVIEPFCNTDGCFEGDYSLFAFIEPGE
ncbi:MAG: PPC domain-containing protein, partial [Persicimonas sp.]